MNYITPHSNALWAGLLLLGGLFSVVAAAKHARNRSDFLEVLADNAAAAKQLATLKHTNACIRAGGAGRKGEDLLRQRVISTLTEMGVEFCTQLHPDHTDAVLLPRGDSPYSREIDLLLVTTFGVYVFEVKHWAGVWSRSGEAGQLDVCYPNRATGHREDPLLKAQGKLHAIAQNLSGRPVCKAIIVNTSTKGSFDKCLHSSYLHLDDLAHFLRSERDRNPVITNFPALRWDVFRQLDGSPNAKHDHLMRLSPTSDHVRQYQENHPLIQQLIRRPQRACAVLRKLQLWISGALLSWSCALAVYQLTPQSMAVQARAGVISAPVASRSSSASQVKGVKKQTATKKNLKLAL